MVEVIRIPGEQDLARLCSPFFFLGVPVVEETVDLWNEVQVDGVLVRHVAAHTFALVHQLVHGFLPVPETD